MAGVLKQCHSEVHQVLLDELLTTAAILLAKNFIHRLTFRDVTQNMPDNLKVLEMMEGCHQYITMHPNPEATLKMFVTVLEGVEPSGPDVAKIIREVSSYY